MGRIKCQVNRPLISLTSFLLNVFDLEYVSFVILALGIHTPTESSQSSIIFSRFKNPNWKSSYLRTNYFSACQWLPLGSFLIHIHFNWSIFHDLYFLKRISYSWTFGIHCESFDFLYFLWINHKFNQILSHSRVE